jgi:hypothetical protein
MKASSDANKVASQNQRNAIAAQKSNEALAAVDTANKIQANARTQEARRKARRSVLTSRGLSGGASALALDNADIAGSLGNQTAILSDLDRVRAGLAIDTGNRVGQYQSQKSSVGLSGLTGALQGAAMGMQMGQAFGGGGGGGGGEDYMTPEMLKAREAVGS